MMPSHDEELRQRYADLLDDTDDPAFVLFLDTLETLHMAHPIPVPAPPLPPPVADANSLTFDHIEGVSPSMQPSSSDIYAGEPTARASRSRWRAIASIAAVVMIVAISIVVFRAAHNAATPAHPSSTQTVPPSAQSLPADTTLNDLAMVSTNEGWAVGATVDPKQDATKSSLTPIVTPPMQGAILHYTDGQWQPYHLALPKIILSSVAMSSPNNGWILGSVDEPGSNVGNQVTSLVVLHYQGGQWASVDVPLFHGITSGTIYAPSDQEAWVIGSTAPTDKGTTNTLFHEANGQWSQVTLPAALTTLPHQTLALSALASFGTGDVWLAASNLLGATPALLAHYANGTWTTVALEPLAYIARVVMVSPRDAWAGGYIADAHDPTLTTPYLLHYDGTSWQPVTLPQRAPASQYPGGNIADIAMLSSSEGWIGGGVIQPAKDYTGAMFYHDVGGQWQPMLTPLPANITSVNRIVMLSANDGWAIGSRVISFPQSSGTGYAYPSVILRYDGTTWKIVEQ